MYSRRPITQHFLLYHCQLYLRVWLTYIVPTYLIIILAIHWFLDTLTYPFLVFYFISILFLMHFNLSISFSFLFSMPLLVHNPINHELHDNPRWAYRVKNKFKPTIGINWRQLSLSKLSMSTSSLDLQCKCF